VEIQKQQELIPTWQNNHLHPYIHTYIHTYIHNTMSFSDRIRKGKDGSEGRGVRKSTFHEE